MGNTPQSHLKVHTMFSVYLSQCNREQLLNSSWQPERCPPLCFLFNCHEVLYMLGQKHTSSHILSCSSEELDIHSCFSTRLDEQDERRSNPRPLQCEIPASKCQAETTQPRCRLVTFHMWQEHRFPPAGMQTSLRVVMLGISTNVPGSATVPACSAQEHPAIGTHTQLVNIRVALSSSLGLAHNYVLHEYVIRLQEYL